MVAGTVGPARAVIVGPAYGVNAGLPAAFAPNGDVSEPSDPIGHEPSGSGTAFSLETEALSAPVTAALNRTAVNTFNPPDVT